MSDAKSSMVRVRKVVSGVEAGKDFYKWHVLGPPFSRGLTGGTKNPKWLVVCRCKCGSVCVVAVPNIVAGVSHGCLKCTTSPGSVKHGMSSDRLYRIWKGMKSRCHDKSDKNYGGRGISVCEEWERSFEEFEKWATANGYSKSLTLDRFPDVNGNYEPGNCRWATWKEQGSNKRNNYYIEAFGESKTFSDWSRDSRCVVSHQLLHQRLAGGWNPEKAIETVAKVYRDKV